MGSMAALLLSVVADGPCNARVKILSVPRQKYPSWVGGSLLTCLSAIVHM